MVDFNHNGNNFYFNLIYSNQKKENKKRKLIVKFNDYFLLKNGGLDIIKKSDKI